MIATLAGRFDDAAADIARRAGCRRTVERDQFALPGEFGRAELARARGDLRGARETSRSARTPSRLVAATAGRSCGSACGSRPSAPARRPSAWPPRAGSAEALPAPTPADRARYRALAAAEAARRVRRLGRRRWRRCREAGDPYLLAYALLRLARGACARAATATAPRRRSARRSRLADDASARRRCSTTRALARAPRPRARRPTANRPAGIDAFGLTEREPRCSAARRRALEPADRRGAVHQPQDGQRPRLEHPRQARRHQPRRGGGRRPPPARRLGPLRLSAAPPI